MPRLAARRFAYYATVIGFGVVVHQGFFAATAGEALTDFLRRNSEAYAMAVLIPAYWDLFAWRGDPEGRSAGLVEQRASQVAWPVGMLVVATILQNSALSGALGLPQSVITLGEAFVAALVIGLYQGWSRGLLPGAASPREGQPVVGARGRAWYYLGIALATLLFHQQFLVSLIGARAVQWLEINEEAYAAMLLLPVFFDVISPSKRRRWLWFALLVVVPVGVASGRLDLLGSVAEWLSRTTEAFLAAIAVSIYFLWWRGDSNHDSTPEMSDGFGK